MERLLAMVGPDNDELRASIAVISAFDEQDASGAALQDLVTLATSFTGARVVLRDDLTNRIVVDGEGDQVAVGADEVDRVTKAAVDAKLRGRRAAELTLDGGGRLDAVWAVNVEYAGVRLGLAWAIPAEGPWRVPDVLALECLAKAAANRLLRDHERSRIVPADRVQALERLLTTPLTAAEAANSARQAGLDPDRRYRVTVFRERPVGAASPEVVLERALQTYAAAGVPAHGCLLEQKPVVVVDESAAVVDALRAAPQDSRSGWWMDAGVAHPLAVADLAAGCLVARQSLALARVEGTGRVGVAEELGALRLLAAIPTAMLEDHPDVKAVGRLAAERDGYISLAVLDVYCETASLRKTAARLYLHHSSVDYRLKRIERVLGFPLTTQAERLRALVSLQLARLLREGAAG
ncbi:helix-turn-helix domain-containing protein [Planosporangium sp. 12N6]|uniref:helix-turn-helix domain-containing protein n=1 Tax=Planosporangium spinosum TaxID=3402278 RepID=UPI003CFA5F4E